MMIKKNLNLVRIFIYSVLFFSFPFTALTQWIEISTGAGPSFDLNRVMMINSSTGFIGSSEYNFPGQTLGKILRTTNGGINWNVVHSDSIEYLDFHFFDSSTGIAGGGYYSFYGKLLKTTNAGLNWQDITPIPLPTNIQDLKFIDVNTGFASGYHGALKTTNGGMNWFESILLEAPESRYRCRMHFVNADIGFLTYRSGFIFKTTNSGSQWTSIRVDQSTAFREIDFTDPNTGFIVGDSGKVYKTTNQGLNWVRLNAGTNSGFYSIEMLNSNTGFIAGEFGVHKTTNAGLNWSVVYNNNQKEFSNSYFLNDTTGFISGSGDLLLKTNSGGVQGIEPLSSEVPRSYTLSQNYPNPFNPVTNINFSIVETGFVNLSVFDALGREIRKLVNEELRAGSYTIKFDAETIPSGIYFYRLSNGSFSDTKKMMLVK
jgi:photosystem II stability/assembly factor-like uncharacterized protein